MSQTPPKMYNTSKPVLIQRIFSSYRDSFASDSTEACPCIFNRFFAEAFAPKNAIAASMAPHAKNWIASPRRKGDAEKTVSAEKARLNADQANSRFVRRV